jgi:UDP-N-acetylmuramate dehydrogenase
MFPTSVPHHVNEPLAKYTSYRIGGPASVLALPRTKEHLWEIGRYLLSSGTTYFVLGNGSNVLAPDEGFPGVVICTKDLEPRLDFEGDGQRVHVSAGTLNARLIRAAAERGLGGIEFLSGVPGNLGGAIFMNAGTASGWIDKAVERVVAVDLKGGEREIDDLPFSYREQHFLKPSEIVWAATLRLKPGDPAEIKARLAEASRKRKEAQPIELPSCGSVFRNPPGKNAWKVIEEAGLRGLARGGACISPKHCNFIVNNGGAKREDVLFLIQAIKEKVRAHSGLEMQQEVILMEPRKL